ncbi:WecB/TagA/CpsF family glycosyltransferase [Mesorhizobium sp. NBSH29]|uniref:WecB/TagA/CpsF family glycosyltransferase n=1 Tax=Mesorhizobium sp. NBSH29 TaxID=2654249 RepID=UPI0018968897|nr:WecB/TagA/CpsF family glycosyltransferase [Mesorhizobium sp. NBSH29]QPC86781.1 WecB/TagA/CpsF family glycosyltransferase [Mesorhizobium sp. NBSH29]
MNLKAIIPTPPTRDILGIAVAELTHARAIEHLLELVANQQFTRVGFLNAHIANVACADPQFRHTLGDFLILPDGVGVDVASKLLHGKPFPANLNGTDFIPALLSAAQTPLTVGMLGASATSIERAASRLRELTPLHTIEIVNDGFFQPDDEAAIRARLETLRPDILLVAMGVPRQEFWMAHNLGKQHCTLPIAVGALFDFLSGAVPRAPGIVRSLRLEWLFRLVIEPGRLWRRYVVGNPLFLFRVFRQKLRGRP